MTNIHLSELTRNGEVRNLSGHDRGQAARAKFGLENLDDSNDVVIVEVPADVYTITPSFFQGMFAQSVRSLGARENFLSKYRFIASPTVLRQIDNGIASSLTERKSIFN